MPVTASYGGTVVIDMTFESESQNDDWAFGVEAQYDSICSGAAGVSGDGAQVKVA